MEFITVDQSNLEKEHICCAIAKNEDCQVKSKKSWLADRFKEGLVFRKADIRGKCFIEYIPAENAWAPVKAENCMYIDCLWVSGKLSGQGYAKALMDDCIRDSKEKGKRGIVALSSEKKKPFLADPAFLTKLGFHKVDEAEPYFSLYYLAFDPAGDSYLPEFREQIKASHAGEHSDRKDSCQDSQIGKGLTLFFTAQCPYTARYVPAFAKVAADRGVACKLIQISSTEEAQQAPTPFPTYGLFYNGKFLTHEILSEKRAGSLLDSL